MDTEKPGNSVAVFALTSGGAALARILTKKLGAHLYLPARLKVAGGLEEDLPENTFFFVNFRETLGKFFGAYRGFIFIMATGIVVRTIAPLLRSKYTDPAVVVMDEAGRFAISLVSGHVGGANRLARQLAALTGGIPVITTATDVRGKPAVDILAKQLNCVPVPPARVKEINRALAEGEPVWLTSQWPVPEELSRGFEAAGPYPSRGWEVIITRDPAVVKEKSLHLLPRNLIAGVGCRRGVSREMIISALDNVLAEIPGGIKRLKALATADIKKDEAAIFQAARHYGLPVQVISRDEIKELEGTYEESEFVKKTVGVGGVCEPAAIIASGRGKIVIPKRKMGPVTVAVAEEKLWWWDWGRGTGSA